VSMTISWITHFAAVQRGKKTCQDRANSEPEQEKSDRGREIVLHPSMLSRGHIRSGVKMRT
jgi:hypothetical protein